MANEEMVNEDGAVSVDEAGAPKLGAEDAGDSQPPKDPNMKWYVVHTYSMFEEKAKSALLERIKQYNQEQHFGEIFVPKISQEQTLKSGKKKKVDKTSFPGYILVEMIFSDEAGHLVKNTPKITGFVGNQRRPRPISDQEVMRLTSPDSYKAQAQETVSDISFDKGETVKVIDGAFTNFDGVVESVAPDKRKLRVLVKIFGRETPVELEFNQVEKTQ